MASRWAFSVTPFVTIRPMPKTVPALPPSAELDRAATHDASTGCGAATDAWGLASDAGMGSNGGPSWWGSAHTKN